MSILPPPLFAPSVYFREVIKAEDITGHPKLETCEDAMRAHPRLRVYSSAACKRDTSFPPS